MKKDHTPPEAISFLSLVELIVKQRHSSDAIADITTHVLGKGKKSRTVLKRAGKPINYIKDSKDSNRWDTAMAEQSGDRPIIYRTGQSLGDWL